MRLATTTSMFAGVALFTLLSYAIVPANAAVADPSAAVKWQPVNDGWDAITIATLEAAFSAVSCARTNPRPFSFSLTFLHR